MRKMSYFAWKARLLKAVLKAGFKLFGVKSLVMASVSGIIEDQGKILVIDLSYADGLALPGGLLQANETFKQGLKREVEEETGLIVEKFRFLGEYPTDDGYPGINQTYIVTAVSGTSRASEEGEVEWMTPVEVLEKLHYKDNRQALKDYMAKIESLSDPIMS
jgi:8-oxo-dGTP diphosphatase